MKRYLGLRQIDDETYEINFRPHKGAERVFKRIKATSKQEASIIRADQISKSKTEEEFRKNGNGIKEASFDDIWLSLEADLLSDSLPLKTRLHYQKTYFRLFKDFRLKKNPHVTKLEQLSLSYFVEYKSYYVNALQRPRGLRAELIIVKAIMHRLYRLDYCPESVIKALKEIKKPRAIKKQYPDISDTKIKELIGQIKNLRPDLYGPIYFMLRTGRRVEETTLIERKDIIWEGINPVRLNIRAETTKMKEVAPLNLLDSELQYFIREAYKESNRYKPPYLFLNRQHRKCDQRKISDFLGSMSEEMFSVRITSHYFRHRFCTECGKANLPFVDVMEICGLKDIEVLTKYYSHSTNEGQAKVLEKTKV